MNPKKIGLLSRKMRFASILVLLASASSAHAEWWEARTNHFIVISEGSSDETRDVANKLERFDGALRFMQGMAPEVADIGDSSRVTIFRTGDESRIEALAGSIGSGIRGFYIPRAGNPVAFVPARADRPDSLVRSPVNPTATLDGMKVLLHEYTHHFMLTTFPSAYPAWYVEGFAELYGNIDLHPDGTFRLGNPPNYRAYELLNMDLLMVEQMLDDKRKMASGAEIFQLYSMGWLMTHYLSFSPARDGQLRQYLTALRGGEASLVAARRIFGDLGKLDGELRRYMTSRLPGLNVRPGNYVAPTVTMRQITGGEADLMRQRIVLTRGVTRNKARDVARQLDVSATRYPAEVAPQLIMAEAYHDALELDRADAAADRALTLVPNSVDALVLKGQIAIDRGKTDPASFARARPFLTRAHTIEKRDPRPLIELYRSYREAHQPVPASAGTALENAFDTASYDADYRMLLAEHLLVLNDTRLARTVLEPVAFSPHGGDPEKNVAAKIVALIDLGKVPEARAMLTTKIDDDANRDDDGRPRKKPK